MDMPSTRRLIIYAAICLLLPLAILALPRPHSQPTIMPDKVTEPVPSVTRPLPGSRSPWTLPEAREALKRRPDDSYLQYVVLQLARQEKRLTDVRDDIPMFSVPPAHGADRFNVLSGADTLQRLQRDAMLGERSGVSSTAISLDTLHGPELPDRSWAQLLGDSKPAVSLLSRCVAPDYFLAEFRALDRLAAVLDAGRSWFAFFDVQAIHDATQRPLRRRLEQQLLLAADDKALGPLTEQVAVTGSNPFLGDGTDVTVLVRVRPETMEAFQSRVERTLAAAAAQPGAGSTRGKHRGIDYVYVATADRRINVYAATLPTKAVHIRSNSQPAFFRIIETALGHASPALGDTAEFQYVRTLLPLGDNNEDGLVYFPAALVRRQLGPGVRIMEARRRLGCTHLRMIAHAAQLYRTQFGKRPASLEELWQTGCTPDEFNKGSLASPVGGTYALSADGVSGLCTVLGTADNLKPGCELPIDSASVEEAAGYRKFVERCDPRAWPGAAPLAMRVQTGLRYVRAEAVLLPPAGNTVHAALTSFLGPSVEALDPLPLPRRNAASIQLRLNKERWIRAYDGLVSPRRLAAISHGAALAAMLPGSVPAQTAWSAAVLVLAQKRLFPVDTPLGVLEALDIDPAQSKALLERGIGNQMGLHLYDSALMVDVSLPTAIAELLSNAAAGQQESVREHAVLAALVACPAYLAIPVKDPVVVDAFLARLDAALARQAPTWRGERLGMPMQGEFYRLTTKAGLSMRSLGLRAGPARLRLFWARIGEGLYIANQPGILDDLQAATTQQARSLSTDRGPVAHAMLRLRPANWALALPGMRLGWEEANREACQRNLALLTAAARAFSFTPPVTSAALDHESRERLVLKYAAQMHGFDCSCPDAGRYALAEDGRSFSCSMHGSVTQPRQPDRPATGNPAERLTDAMVTLTVTSETVRLVLTLAQQ
jgi:hypothetical protein